MNPSQFATIQAVEDITKLENPQIGTKFLYGRTMLSQKEKIEIGREISYYEIIDIKRDGNIEYKVCIDRLERPKMED